MDEELLPYQFTTGDKATFPEAQGFSRDNLYRMSRFYRFYTEQGEIVAQLVRQLQPAEIEGNTIVAQVAPQIDAPLLIANDSVPAEPFPFFLGMVPWGHHIEILQSCKDVKKALFYVEKTIQNNWSRAMLSHAIAAGFYSDTKNPLNNFALTLPKPQDNPTIGILICQKANREKVEWTLEGFNKPMGVSTYTDNLMRMVEEHLDALQVVTSKS